MPPVVGVILAGGAGHRMGGVVKPLLPLHPGTLFSWSCDRLGPQVCALALSVHDSLHWGGEGGVQQAFSFDGPVLCDRVEVRAEDRQGRVGPLAGCLAALDWAEGTGADWVTVVPGDTPFIPPDLVARLWSAAQGGGLPSAHARSSGRDHPAVALLHVSLRPRLALAVAAGERRAWRWLVAQGTQAVDWPFGVHLGKRIVPLDPFWNVNLPQDLEQAQSMVAHETS